MEEVPNDEIENTPQETESEYRYEPGGDKEPITLNPDISVSITTPDVSNSTPVDESVSNDLNQNQVRKISSNNNDSGLSAPPPNKPHRSSKVLNFKLDQKWLIEIPWYKTHIKGKEEYTLFTLRVFYGDMKWTVEKRFSECFEFSQELNRKYEGVPHFPPRRPKIFHDPKFLQSRMADLALYFQQFDQAAFATEEMRNFLHAYTELKKLGVYGVVPEKQRLHEVHNSPIYCATTTITLPNHLKVMVRMTVVKLSTNSISGKHDLLLYAPIPYEDATRMELDELGHVRYIVAPTKIHCVCLPDYIEKFPDAIVFTAPGVKEKLNIAKGTVITTEGNLLGEEFEYILTKGNSNFSELVLFHKESKYLIVADLIINFPHGFFETQQYIEDALAIATDYYAKNPYRPMCSPEHIAHTNDLQEFQNTIKRIQNWQFVGIIMAQGNILDDTKKAHEALKEATDSLVKTAGEKWSVASSVFSFFGKK